MELLDYYHLNLKSHMSKEVNVTMVLSGPTRLLFLEHSAFQSINYTPIKLLVMKGKSIFIHLKIKLIFIIVSGLF